MISCKVGISGTDKAFKSTSITAHLLWNLYSLSCIKILARTNFQKPCSMPFTIWTSFQTHVLNQKMDINIFPQMSSVLIRACHDPVVPHDLFVSLLTTLISISFLGNVYTYEPAQEVLVSLGCSFFLLIFLDRYPKLPQLSFTPVFDSEFVISIYTLHKDDTIISRPNAFGTTGKV